MAEQEPAVAISPTRYSAAIFDLDGVITRTAQLHAGAWKELFDAYLAGRSARDQREYAPFDIERDYSEYVDGKPRYAGLEAFLRSRDISLPYGDPEDPPGKDTVCGLGNRKDELFHQRLRRQGVRVYDAGVGLVSRLRQVGIKTAVVSSSKNCAAVLAAAGLEPLFDARVDGAERERLHLEGKPAPDMFLEAARRLGTAPARCVVVEDAAAGVEAGARGGFGCVIGVDRGGKGTILRDRGAHIVVTELSRIAVVESSDE